MEYQMVDDNLERDNEPGTLVPGFDVDMGDRLKWAVSQIGSQRQAGAIANVKPEMIGKYVSGRAKPSFYAIRALAEGAGVSLDWLATGEPAILRDHEIQLLIDESKMVELRKSEENARSVDELASIKEKILSLQKYLSASHDYILSLRRLVSMHGPNKERVLRAVSAGAPDVDVEPRKIVINEQKLTSAIDLIETWLAQNRRKMEPAKKAQVIVMAYEILTESGDSEIRESDRNNVIRLLRVAS
jgi:transcriptional regulator with XRE-family HTH domain